MTSVKPSLAERETTFDKVQTGPGAQVIRRLRSWVDEGVLVHGQPLPSERSLSEELGVNRKTIRRALAILEEDGVLRSRTGGTRIVTAPGANRGSGVLTDGFIVISSVAAQPWIQHRESGWQEYVTHGALHAIRNAGANAVLLQSAKLSEGDVRKLAMEQPRGVLIMDFESTVEQTLRWAGIIKKAGTPVGIYRGAAAPAEFDQVASDHEAGSYALTTWILGQGRRRPVPLWYRHAVSTPWYAPRRAGYERAMHDAGLEPLDTLEVPDLLRTTEDAESWFSITSKQIGVYLRDYFRTSGAADALLLHTDGILSEVSAACRLAGRDPRGEIALLGYDNYWRESIQQQWEPAPPLATVDKQNLKMGAQLVQLVSERIEGSLPAAAQMRLVQPELVLMEPAAAR